MDTFQRDIAKAQKELAEMDKRIGASLPQAAQAGALVLEEEAKRRAPRRTGKLQDSIKNRKGKRKKGSAEHVVYTDLFYAPFVEYGTRKMSKRPFMRPAADTKQAEIAAAMEDAVLRADGI